MRRGELDSLEGFKAGQAWHVLVEYDKVEVLLRGKFKCVGTAACGHDVVAFAFEKEDVGFQEVDLIVGPEYG